MKFKLTIIFVLAIGLLVSCKSKKPVTRKYHPKKVDEIQKMEKITSANTAINSYIKNSTIEYIEKFKDISMEEMKVYNIPASITLAQGILESTSGNSELTRKSNNHFGIKCHKGWKGKRVYHDDDKKDDCFRVYSDPTTSFKDHSLFLTTRRRYAALFKLKRGDYVRWARGLSQAGYATDRRYPAKLIALIEKYDLHKYDREVLGKHHKKNKNKKVVNHIVVKGDTLYSISKKYSLTVDQLKNFNGLTSNEISIGQTLILTK